MPTQLAEYGIAFFAIGAIIYLAKAIIDAFAKRATPNTPCADKLSKVIENNSKALEENTKASQALQTTLQVALTKQEGMLDEILVRVRNKEAS